MLARQKTDTDLGKKSSAVNAPLVERPKTCRFQLDRNKYIEAAPNAGYKSEKHANSVEETAKTNNSEKQEVRQEPKLRSLESRQRLFITNTRRSVERRRRLESPWMHGHEMQHFYSVWQQPLTTPKGRMKKPLRRVQSLFKDFRYADEKNKHTRQDDFGIVRECCCHIRSRIRMPSDPL